MRNYGIYLAYPPDVDLRAEGLGRHLAMFLKGAEAVGDVKFKIVCPSWARKNLELLFQGEDVSCEVFEIFSPEGQPYILTLFQSIRSLKTRGSLIVKIYRRLKELIWRGGNFVWQRLLVSAVSVRGLYSLVLLIAESTFWFVVLFPIILLSLPFIFLKGSVVVLQLLKKLRGWMPERLAGLIQQAKRMAIKPERSNIVLRAFEKMQEVEISRMMGMIDGLKDVSAWYCPTAFWPEVNKINTPKIICVPDVVLSDFPVEFSKIGGNWALHSFKKIEQTINDGEFFVTYSKTTKWKTLVDRYGIPSRNVKVIDHAPNNLNSWIEGEGGQSNATTTKAYCVMLLNEALARCGGSIYSGALADPDFKYIFYASQIRPNKNVMTLLRAYNYLLKRRFIGVKLFLTGNPNSISEVRDFIYENGLDRDVVFLQNLSVSELAAAYKMATLAVNPSLSEGGCPFTFSEALSVGTPVVMSRISVAEEVLSNKQLQMITFFDPYDWKDCANRIEWGLKHTAELLRIQNEVYSELRERSWGDVVREYVDFLDFVARKSEK